MSTKSSVDLRAELAELVKRKAEIAVSTEAIVPPVMYFYFLINYIFGIIEIIVILTR